MNKLVIMGVASIAILGGLVWLSYPDGNAPAKGNGDEGAVALAAEHLNFDFGTISMAAGNVEHTYKIKNPSDSDIRLTKIYTSCMCTVAELKLNGSTFGPFGMPGHGGPVTRISQVLKAGEEAELIVTFDPAAHGPAGIGRVDRGIYIENDGGDPLQVTFVANVTP